MKLCHTQAIKDNVRNPNKSIENQSFADFDMYFELTEI